MSAKDPSKRRLCKYGYPGEPPQFCSVHKKEGMVHIYNTCKHDSCTLVASFAMPGQRAKFCGQHKEMGMIDVSGKKCSHASCNRQSTHALPGQRAIVCSHHKTEGMVIVGRACRLCTKYAIYALPGQKNPQFCKEHKTPDMVDVWHKTCAHESCTKRPTFSLPGQPAEFCKKHKAPDMLPAQVSRRCSHESCDTLLSNGGMGEEERYCAKHRAPITVDISDQTYNSHSSKAHSLDADIPDAQRLHRKAGQPANRDTVMPKPEHQLAKRDTVTPKPEHQPANGDTATAKPECHSHAIAGIKQTQSGLLGGGIRRSFYTMRSAARGLLPSMYTEGGLDGSRLPPDMRTVEGLGNTSIRSFHRKCPAAGELLSAKCIARGLGGRSIHAFRSEGSEAHGVLSGMRTAGGISNAGILRGMSSKDPAAGELLSAKYTARGLGGRSIQAFRNEGSEADVFLPGMRTAGGLGNAGILQGFSSKDTAAGVTSIGIHAAGGFGSSGGQRLIHGSSLAVVMSRAGVLAPTCVNTRAVTSRLLTAPAVSSGTMLLACTVSCRSWALRAVRAWM